jgi:hypothetical protein
MLTRRNLLGSLPKIGDSFPIGSVTLTKVKAKRPWWSGIVGYFTHKPQPWKVTYEFKVKDA